jgi:hypothetical protein
MNLDLITTVAAILLVLVAWILIARGRPITIAVISNGTGHRDIDDAATSASVNFRFTVDNERRRIENMMRGYRRRVRNAPSEYHALALTEMNSAALANKEKLVTGSLQVGQTQGIAALILFVGQLFASTRSATVTASLHRLDPGNSRLGIEVDMEFNGRSSHRLISEPEKPDLRRTTAERFDMLIGGAARCAAIDLETWTLLRARRFPFPGGKRRREGLARNMAGLLFSASAATFRPFAALFREFAVDELEIATDRLPDDYEPHFNLATVHEAEAESTAGPRRYRAFKSADGEYSAAGKAADRLPEPARAVVKRQIMVRRIRAELISDIPQLRRHALDWLLAQRLRVRLDCHYIRLRRPWPVGIIWPGHVELALDKLSADFLYNSACMYAIAAEVRSQSDWDRHARRLLGTALVIDAAEGDLWDQAATDPDLRRLSVHLPDFLETLRNALPTCPQDVPLAEIVGLVDDVATATGWHAVPGKRVGSK